MKKENIKIKIGYKSTQLISILTKNLEGKMNPQIQVTNATNQGKDAKNILTGDR